MKEAMSLFGALGDATRVRLLGLLAGGERCVCELIDEVRAPQPTVSRHLAHLKRAGLVRDRRNGKWRHYSLHPARSAAVRGCLRSAGIAAPAGRPRRCE